MFDPTNGRVPVNSSWKTMARLYWSVNRVKNPSNVSGAAYTGVTPPVIVPRAPSKSLASPKSATLAWLYSRKMFCGLMSRCWIWYWLFIRSSASADSSMYWRSSARGMPTMPRARHSRNRSHKFRSASSITMMSCPSMMSNRSSDRMYGWRICLTRCRALSSCSAGLPSSSALSRSPNTNFIALCRPPGASTFQTSPNPPRPSRSRSLYPGSGSSWLANRTGMGSLPEQVYRVERTGI